MRKTQGIARWIRVIVFLARRNCGSLTDIMLALGETNKYPVLNTLSRLARRGVIKRLWLKGEKRAKKIRIYCIK